MKQIMQLLAKQTTLLCYEDCTNKLTTQELKARDIMVNAFNPVLKFFLSQANPTEWERYGYNSCRQTAIFGTVYLKELLPDYEIVPYEGEFIEKYDGKTARYIHCFIVASKDERHLIIDISRTSKKLLFNVIDDIKYPYPKIGDYQKVSYLHSKPIDMETNFYNCTFREFFTKESPMKVMNMIRYTIDSLNAATLLRLNISMYGQYTTINR